MFVLLVVAKDDKSDVSKALLRSGHNLPYVKHPDDWTEEENE
jgi:hypothetical protein